MKKNRRLSLNKVSIVSLKNMNTIIGGNTSQGGGGAICDTATVNDTLITGVSGCHPCSTGTNDPNQYLTTTNGDTFGLLMTQPGNECKVDDLTD